MRTLLGLGIGIILWHPEQCLGGMSHAIWPGRDGPGDGNRLDRDRLDGRHADEAVALLVAELDRHRVSPGQCFAYLIGGGEVSPGTTASGNVSTLGLAAARAELERAGIPLGAEYIGKIGYRKVVLDLISGKIAIDFGGRCSDPVVNCG